MTASRDTILATLRRSLHVDSDDTARRSAVQDRIARAPVGIVPKRAQLPDDERIALFASMVDAAAATVERVAEEAEVPDRVADYLRGHNLPQRLVCGSDPWLSALPWDRQPNLEVKVGAADGSEEVGVSHAFGAIAESGTLALASGTDNPTTVNFLPETHIVAVRAADVAGDLETVVARLRETYGKGAMPRTVNLITGPSRSGDIEQTLQLGAHGPRRLHVIIVG